MLLSVILASRFSSTIRERGYQYFRQKLVTILHGSSSELTAEVRGSERYQLLLQISGTRLNVLCSCPYFVDKNEPCKHLWATILAADAEHHLTDVISASDHTLDTETLLGEIAESEFGEPEFAEKDADAAVQAVLDRKSAVARTWL